MKKQILYLHGRPSSHFLHNSLATSLGVDKKFIDEKYRWQDQNFGSLKNIYAWIKNAFSYKEYATKYDFILTDGLHFSPIIARKMGLLPNKIKIISHMGNQLPYFILEKKIPAYSRFMHKWLFTNYDYIFCEGDMMQEMILQINPDIKNSLYPTFLGPLNSRINALRVIKPTFQTNNIITIASGPGDMRIYYKGLDIMIEAFVNAKKQLPLLKYYIAGDWSEKDIENLSKKYTPTEFNDIFFIGNQTHIHTYLQDSDLCIHVSRGDAFPTSTIETMHAGIPIIVSDITGTKQILKKVNSNLIIKLSSDELVEKIVWFFNLPVFEKNELSSKLKEVSFNFTEDTAIQHYKKTFEQIANKNN